MRRNSAKHLLATALGLFALTVSGATHAAARDATPTIAFADNDKHDAFCMLSMPVDQGGVKAYSMMMFFFGRIVGRHPEARFNGVVEYALPYFTKLSAEEQKAVFLDCQSEFNTIYQSK